MPRFLCFACRRPITLPVRKIPLPYPPFVEIAAGHGDRIQPPRMPRGTYAAHHRPGEFEQEPPGLVIHPDDAIGMRVYPDLSHLSGCCGISPVEGRLNLVCESCGAELATHLADCWTRNQITLHADAVICRTPTTDRQPSAGGA